MLVKIYFYYFVARLFQKQFNNTLHSTYLVQLKINRWVIQLSKDANG